MFCSTCGAGVTEDLNYCNRCGARLTDMSKPAAKLPPPIKLKETLQFLSAITGAVAVIGVFLVVLLAQELVKFGMLRTDGLILLGLTLLVVFGISGLFIRQLSRVLDAYLESAKNEPHNHSKPWRRRQQQIEPPPQAVSSITENTTRTLENS